MKKQNFCECGKVISRTARKCKSCALKGNKRLLGHIPTAETRLRLSESHRGIRQSEQAKRKAAEAKKGALNPNWNGGKANIRGYVQILRPQHPAASFNGYVLEHRLVMEQILGRPLGSGEVVHHRDGNRSNNHPSNLQLFSDRGEHAAYHRQLRRGASA